MRIARKKTAAAAACKSTRVMPESASGASAARAMPAESSAQAAGRTAFFTTRMRTCATFKSRRTLIIALKIEEKNRIAM